MTATGENLGVLSLEQALIEARNRELDLVLIVETANPPVAKILDYNKFLYEENKKSSSTKTKKTELKEFRFGPAIGEGDLQTRIRRARDFLNDKNQVKFTVQLKGRQAAFPQVAMEKLERVVQELSDVAKVDGSIKARGNFIFVTFLPK